MKREIARVAQNGAGRRRFGRTLRDRIVRYAIDEQKTGRRLRKIAAELDLREQLLGGWVRKAHGPGPVRVVEIVEEIEVTNAVLPSRKASSALRVVLANGAIVEGLSLKDVAELIRQAS